MIIPYPLVDKDGVAVAEKSVLFLNCLCVGLKNKILAGKSRDKHKKGRSRGMEIGKESVYNFKFITGINKNGSIPLPSPQFTCGF